MKKIFCLTMAALFMMSLCGCSNDDGDNLTYDNPYKDIIGEWKLVKAIPEGDTLLGIDFFCFYPDSSFTCNNVTESGTFHGKFEVNEQQNWEVGTIDYKHLPTNYCLWLYNDIETFATFPFVIEGDKMHINVGGPSYVYSAFMFERVK